MNFQRLPRMSNSYSTLDTSASLTFLEADESSPVTSETLHNSLPDKISKKKKKKGKTGLGTEPSQLLVQHTAQLARSSAPHPGCSTAPVSRNASEHEDTLLSLSAAQPALLVTASSASCPPDAAVHKHSSWDADRANAPHSRVLLKTLTTADRPQSSGAYEGSLPEGSTGSRTPQRPASPPPSIPMSPRSNFPQSPRMFNFSSTYAPASVLSPASLSSSQQPPPTSSLPLPTPPASQPIRTDHDRLQGFFEYLRAEAHPAEKLPTADVVWGQTERDRVYNFLIYVPYQFERLVWFGTLLCMDSFLAVMTMLPYRCIVALTQLITGTFSRWRRPATSSTSEGSEQLVTRKPLLGGSQVYDLLCLMLLILGTALLCKVRPGSIYYWLKDITSEFLKLSVLSTAFEILDKILCNFGIDVLEALSGTCTQWVMGKATLAQLALDFTVAQTIVVLHSLTLMCQALVFAVALNSAWKHGMVALLIAHNFTEIKGAVFKKWDIARIWSLACQDIVERFHLLTIGLFILVEDMDSSSAWAPSPNLVWECARILGAEVVIDILKHAVLGKFNEIRPGIYREFMRDLCEKCSSNQSHTMHKLLNFHHLGPAALVLRTGVTLFWLHAHTTLQLVQRAVVVLCLWVGCLCFKPLLGFALKAASHFYVNYYNRNYQKLNVRTNAQRAKLQSKQE